MKPSLMVVCLCVALAVGGSEVSFTSSLDTSRQSCFEIEPPNGQTKAGALIALHGHGSGRHQVGEEARDECLRPNKGNIKQVVCKKSGIRIENRGMIAPSYSGFEF